MNQDLHIAHAPTLSLQSIGTGDGSSANILLFEVREESFDETLDEANVTRGGEAMPLESTVQAIDGRFRWDIGAAP